MDRRSFLRSIFATAVAASLPLLPKSKQDAIVEHVTNAVRVSLPKEAGLFFGFDDNQAEGERLASSHIQTSFDDLGGDMYRVIIRTAPSDGISVSVASGDPAGLFIGDMDSVRSYLMQHPDRIACNGLSLGGSSELNFVVMG